MTDKELKDILTSMTDSLSALTAQQAIIIELLSQKLPGISDEERMMTRSRALILPSPTARR
jgi:hypothetical protein